MSPDSARSTIARLASSAIGGILTLDSATETLRTSRLAASRRLSALVRAGWLDRVRRGVYSVRPLDAVRGTPIAEEDPWTVAMRVFDPCYIGGWTAAGHWHLTEQLFWATMVVTKRHARRADVTVGSSAFHVVRESRKNATGLSIVWRANSPVRVSSVARTIVDACAHPEWVGGGSHLVSIFRAAVADDLIKPESLLVAARGASTGAALGRLAVLAERYLPAALHVIAFAKAHRSTGYVRFDPAVKKRGSLNTRWGIWLNVEFDKAAA